MQFRNSKDQYGLMTKGLHWVVGLLIMGLIWLGWYMVDLTYYHPWYYDSLMLHRSLGMVALVVALLMIGSRLHSRPPGLVSTIKPWERLVARLVHATLYTMMVLIPVTGYLISTSEGDPIALFGRFDIPAIIPVDDQARDWAIVLHYYLAYGTASLIGVHALGALKHQFIDHDGTLKRML